MVPGVNLHCLLGEKKMMLQSIFKYDGCMLHYYVPFIIGSLEWFFLSLALSPTLIWTEIGDENWKFWAGGWGWGWRG
jgi:hypothetical protein